MTTIRVKTEDSVESYSDIIDAFTINGNKITLIDSEEERSAAAGEILAAEGVWRTWIEAGEEVYELGVMENPRKDPDHCVTGFNKDKGYEIEQYGSIKRVLHV